jgi:hypothetical protein
MLGLLAAVAVMGMAAMTLSPMGAVHAETGRRICEYSFKKKVKKYEKSNPKMTVSIGMDYKKDGKCPSIDAQKLIKTGYVDADQVAPNPVPKVTCEKWKTEHNLVIDPKFGNDPCLGMKDDELYVIMIRNPSENGSYTGLGSWRTYS